MRIFSVRWWSGMVVLVACGGQSASHDGRGNGVVGGAGPGSGAGGTAQTGGAGTAAGGATPTGGSSEAGGGAVTTGGSSVAGGGVTTGGSAGAGGSSSGTAGAGGTPDCGPMDARSSGDDCAAIPGFVWDGSMCHPIFCACEGSDCDALYATIDDCDRARAGCYVARGVRRECTRHADCGLAPRACCEPCGTPGPESFLGVNAESALPGVCVSMGCPDCLSMRDPAIYPICLGGQCTVGDLREAAACTSAEECVVRTKDCCECNSDATERALMAVGPGLNGVPPWCTNLGCPRCAATPVPATVTATCDARTDHCRVVLP